MTEHTHYASPVDTERYGVYGTTQGFTPGASFQRPAPDFTGRISADGSSGFLAEPGRYHLYLARGCPWCHRTAIARRLKGLQDVIGVSFVDDARDGRGWAFRESNGPDPINDFALMSEAYEASAPGYHGHVSLPVLWDRHAGQIVANESSLILRDLETAFDALATEDLDLYPEARRTEIDALNDIIYHDINNGSYRVIGATSPSEYERERQRYIARLEDLDRRLASSRYLLGEEIVETDVRLYPSLVRFDALYNQLGAISERPLAAFPNLWGYARDLWQRHPAFNETIDFATINAFTQGPRESWMNDGSWQITPPAPNHAGWDTPPGRESLTRPLT